MKKLIGLSLLAFLLSSCNKPGVSGTRTTVDGQGGYTISFVFTCDDSPTFVYPKVISEGRTTTVLENIDSIGPTYYFGSVCGYLHDLCDSTVVPIKVVCHKDTMDFSVMVHSAGIQANTPSKVNADPATGLFTYDLEIGCCDQGNGTFTISPTSFWNATDLRATPATVSCPGPGGIQHVSIVGKLRDVKRDGDVSIYIKGPKGECVEHTRIIGTK
jgi:hypothetical protein